MNTATAPKIKVTKTAVLGAFRAAFGQRRSDMTIIINLLCAIDRSIQYRDHANPRTRDWAKEGWTTAQWIAREGWGATLGQAPADQEGFVVRRDGAGRVEIPQAWLDWVMDRK
jgi:hypothetical protein